MEQRLIPIQPDNSIQNSTNSTGTTGPLDAPKSSSNKGIGIGVGVAAAILVLVSGATFFFILKKRKQRISKEIDAIAPPESNEEDQAEKIRNGFAKAELGADSEHARSELAGPGVPKLGDGRTFGYGNKDGNSLPHELKGPDVAELEDERLRHEMSASSAAPIELPGDFSVELPGSTPLTTNPSSVTSSPILRAANRSPINRSMAPSPLNRSLGSPSPLNRSSRPPFTNRASTMDSVASSVPSLPNQPSGKPSPLQGPTAAPSVSHDALNPASWIIKEHLAKLE